MNVRHRSHVAALLVTGSLAVWAVATSPRVVGAVESCMGAPATIVGDNDANPGDGTITGTEGHDVIIGTEGDDIIEGGGGDDRICGLGGADTLRGGDGFDRLNGGPDVDTCASERTVNCENVSEADDGPAPEPAPADPGAEPAPAPAPGDPAPGPNPAMS